MNKADSSLIEQAREFKPPQHYVVGAGAISELMNEYRGNMFGLLPDSFQYGIHQGSEGRKEGDEVNNPTVNILDIEVFADKAVKLANMALALEQAMFEGPTSADEFGGSMNLFVDLMLGHAKDMKGFFDAAMASRKEGATV